MKEVKVAFLLPSYFGSNHSLFLGVGYLAATVKAQGDHAIIIDEDAITYIYSKENQELSLQKAKKRVLLEIDKYKPNILCMMINTANYRNALNMLKYVRKQFPYIYMIVGGPHITTCYRTFSKWHRDLFDVAIIGEGEIALCQIINNYKINELHHDLPGVYYSNDNDSLIPGKIVNINKLPYPDRGAFFEIYSEHERIIAVENYNRVFYSNLPGFNNGHARIIATRGCYNNCAFCSPGVFWKNPETLRPCRRIRHAKDVVDEIEDLVNKGIGAIYFDDPTFPIKSNLLFFDKFEQEILKRELYFNWGAPICSDEIDSYLLDRLQRIGFSYTYFGLENYKEENLNSFKKKQDVRKCLELISECKKRGIHCDASYQIGLPNETKEDIKKSIDWIFSHKIERNTFYSITAIWPSTEIAIEYNVLPDCYEPDFNKKDFENRSGLFFYEQGNPIIEPFYSNCSGTYHFIPMDLAIEMKYYVFDSGLTNRFSKKQGT